MAGILLGLYNPIQNITMANEHKRLSGHGLFDALYLTKTYMSCVNNRTRQELHEQISKSA